MTVPYISDPAVSDRQKKQMETVALLTVAAMASYQWVMCFLNTNVMGVTSTLVAVAEAIIVGVVGFFILKTVYGQRLISYFLLLAGYFILIWTVKGEYDVQVLRNILLIFLFFLLGKIIHNVDTVDRILFRVCCLVLAIALVEYFFTETYLAYFNIQKYFFDRGLLEEIPTFLDQNVSVNGIRLTGRNILPFLGDNRISSVFMEPVSMGNLATIVAMWGFSLPKEAREKSWKHFVMAALFVIAADSRFASLMIFLLFLVHSFRFLRQPVVYYFLPVFAVLVLFLLYAFLPKDGLGDNYIGRLQWSGEELWHTTVFQWFGVGESRNLGDMGVAYSIENFGLPLIVALWFIFTSLKPQSEQGKKFHAFIAYYAIGILMISGTSLYSAKTAPILWLLMGCLAASRSSYEQSENQSMVIMHSKSS